MNKQNFHTRGRHGKKASLNEDWALLSCSVHGHKEDFVISWDLCYDTDASLISRLFVEDKGAIMPLEITQKQLLQALTQQAISWFGEEQARDLQAQLEERAAYLWLLSQHLPDREQEPDFLCSLAHDGKEG